MHEAWKKGQNRVCCPLVLVVVTLDTLELMRVCLVHSFLLASIFATINTNFISCSFVWSAADSWLGNGPSSYMSNRELESDLCARILLVQRARSHLV